MSKLKILYKQTNFPILQNRVYDTYVEAVNCPTGDIELVEDLNSGLVYNAAFRKDLMLYDSNYNNEQSFSKSFHEHLEHVASIIATNIGKQNIIEVGCGKGFFLEMLITQGFNIVGFDPAYEGNNACIVKEYFKPDLIKPAEGLILRHVLEHVPDPVEFLFALKYANNGNGRIYIEVPCFDWICKKRAWFDIFYEHVNYFSLHDFKKMFSSIVDCGHLFGGQYIYVVAELSSLQSHIIANNEQIDFPRDFDKKVTSDITQQQCAIWGASSKGVVYSLLKSRHSQKIDFAIDINPKKQGKYLPVTGLLVYSPEQAMQKLKENATIYIMNSNYFNEISEITQRTFKLVRIDYE